MKDDTYSTCRDCRYRHGARNPLYLPRDLLCPACVPLPPEGFQPNRVGYRPENGVHYHAQKRLRRKIHVRCRTKGCPGIVTQRSRSGLCIACTIRATNRRRCPFCGKGKATHSIMCVDCRKSKEAAARQT